MLQGVPLIEAATGGESVMERFDRKTLEEILSYLWFTDISTLSVVNRSLHGVLKGDKYGLRMLLQLNKYLYREALTAEQTQHWAQVLSGSNNDTAASAGSTAAAAAAAAASTLASTTNSEEITFSRTDSGLSLLLFCRRLSSWPTAIDTTSLAHEARNVSILCPDGRPGVLCAVYGGRRKESHKGYTVVATDDHFPCLPGTFTQPRHKNEGEMQAWERLPRVELQKTKKQSVVCRCLAPFARLLHLPRNRKVATLSCVAYFEATVHLNQGYSAIDDIRRFSVGLACALFPLRKKHLGFDNYSFAYHRDGNFVHGNRSCGLMAAYSPGDTVGCGLVYPPLSGAHRGKIFFTKNGELAGLFDMGVDGLLSLPWFPALVRIFPFLFRSFDFSSLFHQISLLFSSGSRAVDTNGIQLWHPPPTTV